MERGKITNLEGRARQLDSNNEEIQLPCDHFVTVLAGQYSQVFPRSNSQAHDCLGPNLVQEKRAIPHFPMLSPLGKISPVDAHTFQFTAFQL